MKFGTLLEIAGAAHLAPYVVSDEVGEERGGIVYVAPPGNLKTTAIEILDQFPRTKLVSNITNSSLTDLRQSFIAGDIRTLGFPDYDMIYKRHGTVSDQIEGTLMGLTGEGWRQPAFKDQRVDVTKARVTVVAGITIKCYEDRIAGWLDTGFARRFLWSRFWVKNPEKMEEALSNWKKAQLDGDFVMRVPVNNTIPYKLTKKRADHILYQLRFQPDRKLPYIFAQRIVSVLLWKHGDKGWSIWNDFVKSLGKDGDSIVI